MRTTLLRAQPDRTASTRVILIPGANQASEDIVAAGFATAACEARADIDLLLVDLELKHLTDRSALAELHERQIPEARRAGCDQLWLGGISFGGFLALLYAERYPMACDGLLLLAPYPGNRMILGDIEGFLSAPEPDAPAAAELAEERRVWRLIRQPPAGSPPLWLGFGSSDRYARAHRLMASSLPPSHVHEVAGGHDWPVWLRLWRSFLSALDGPLDGAK